MPEQDLREKFGRNQLMRMKLNINQRYDHFLNVYSDKSFVNDNYEIPNSISSLAN